VRIARAMAPAILAILPDAPERTVTTADPAE
jgi:hypothetical protein